mgnify:CR=1 FL=1
MSTSDVRRLKSALKKHWPSKPGYKAERYVGQFFNATRFGTKIAAEVVGNHGTYTVSIQINQDQITSVCSCYIGKHGYCHHCHALAATFLKQPNIFIELKQRTLDEVVSVTDIPEYLRSVTLDDLIQQLKKQGITQKALAESIGMSSQKLSAIKSSEKRNRYFHELGATKLACLWVLERFAKK